MYHIKDDFRCQKSAESLVSAMHRLMKKKEIDDISISDLQRESGIGRSTFYRLFDTTDDLLAYLIECELNPILDEMKNRSGYESLFQFVKYFSERGQTIAHLFSSGKSHLLFNCCRKCIYHSYALHLAGSDIMAEYFISSYAGIILSSLAVWYAHGQKESVDELCAVIEKTILSISKYSHNYSRIPER